MNQSTLPVNSVRFGVFEFDLRSRELRKHGIRIKLQEQPCQILAFLLERRGEMVTRDELQRHLWPSDTFVDFDHSLNTAVMRLREALNDSSENPRFIETLPRRGYRFIAPFEERSASGAETTSAQIGEVNATQSAVVQESPTLPPHSQVLMGTSTGKGSPGLRPAVALATMLLLVLALAGGLGFRYLRKPSVVAAPPKQITSIVVLPLENLSADKDQAYFADGMTAELVQVATDRHLWADTYESPFGDVLTLQSRVASAIVNEIRINLTPEEQQRLASARPISAESYEDYLKGRFYWNKRSEEGLTRAIEYFQLATQKDPHSALAFAGLADCYSIIGSAIVGSVPSQEVAPKARVAALKALELDKSLAEAQTSLATVQFNYDWNWAAAGNGFQRSIELNPSYATAYQRYSLYLMAMGRTAESLTQMNRARDLDPLSISMNFSLGWRLYMARQYDQAISQLRNTLEMDPNFALPRMVLGQAYEQKGLYQQAIVELQKAAAISHDSPPMLGALGHAFGVAGNKAEADKLLGQLLEQSKKQYVSPFYVSIVYAGLHENEKAMDWLEKAYEDRSNAIIFLKVDPDFDGLRSNPRFQALLRRLALQE